MSVSHIMRLRKARVVPGFRPVLERMAPLFRHVVLFKWADDASVMARDAAVDALQAWATRAATYGQVTVGTDAGLASGNHHVAVVADFPDRASYQRYASDPAHLELVREHIAPLVSSRAAVQHSW